MKKLIACLSALVLLAGFATPAAAAAHNADAKEEVIYGVLAGDGTPERLLAVNIITPQDGAFTDYGPYTELRNLTTGDALAQAGDRVSANTTAERLYYEGVLEGAALPWNIDISYRLNGLETDAAALAGAQGSLLLRLAISRNEAVSAAFFDTHALLVTISLDTALCDSITAPGATIANVGSVKQLSYTILPGRGTEIEVAANVRDFEMEEISVNAVRLCLDVEIDDAGLQEKADALLEGVAALDNGAAGLHRGADRLAEAAAGSLAGGAGDLAAGSAGLRRGAGGLVAGAEGLEQGVAALRGGARGLEEGFDDLLAGIYLVGLGMETLSANTPVVVEGSASVYSALQEIEAGLAAVAVSADGIAALLAAGAEVEAGLESLVAGAEALYAGAGFARYKERMAQNGVDIDAVLAGNAQAAENAAALRRQMGTLFDAVRDTPYYEEAAEAEAYAALDGMAALAQANNAALAGTEQHLNGIAAGAGELQGGALALQNGYAQLYASLAGLAADIEALVPAIARLAGGTQALVREYAALDDGLQAYAGGVSQVAAGFESIRQGAQALAGGTLALREGADALAAGSGALTDGTREVQYAANAVADGSGTLRGGVDELVAAVGELENGAEGLAGGAAALRRETAALDLEAEIDTLLENLTGQSGAVVSFVSEKNTNITSVQFVLRTPAITVTTPPEPVEDPQPQAGFWQRLRRLFR